MPIEFDKNQLVAPPPRAEHWYNDPSDPAAFARVYSTRQTTAPFYKYPVFPRGASGLVINNQEAERKACNAYQEEFKILCARLKQVCTEVNAKVNDTACDKVIDEFCEAVLCGFNGSIGGKYAEQPAAVFEEIKLYLEEIVCKLTNPEYRKTHVITNRLSQFIQTISVCEGGAHTELNRYKNELADPRGVIEFLHLQRREIIERMVAKHIDTKFDYKNSLFDQETIDAYGNHFLIILGTVAQLEGIPYDRGSIVDKFSPKITKQYGDLVISEAEQRILTGRYRFDQDELLNFKDHFMRGYTPDYLTDALSDYLNGQIWTLFENYRDEMKELNKVKEALIAERDGSENEDRIEKINERLSSPRRILMESIETLMKNFGIEEILPSTFFNYDGNPDGEVTLRSEQERDYGCRVAANEALLRSQVIQGLAYRPINVVGRTFDIVSDESCQWISKDRKQVCPAQDFVAYLENAIESDVNKRNTEKKPKSVMEIQLEKGRGSDEKGRGYDEKGRGYDENEKKKDRQAYLAFQASLTPLIEQGIREILTPLFDVITSASFLDEMRRALQQNIDEGSAYSNLYTELITSLTAKRKRVYNEEQLLNDKTDFIIENDEDIKWLLQHLQYDFVLSRPDLVKALKDNESLLDALPLPQDHYPEPARALIDLIDAIGGDRLIAQRKTLKEYWNESVQFDLKHKAYLIEDLDDVFWVYDSKRFEGGKDFHPSGRVAESIHAILINALSKPDTNKKAVDFINKNSKRNEFASVKLLSVPNVSSYIDFIEGIKDTKDAIDSVPDAWLMKLPKGVLQKLLVNHDVFKLFEKKGISELTAMKHLEGFGETPSEKMDEFIRCIECYLTFANNETNSEKINAIGNALTLVEVWLIGMDKSVKTAARTRCDKLFRDAAIAFESFGDLFQCINSSREKANALKQKLHTDPLMSYSLMFITDVALSDPIKFSIANLYSSSQFASARKNFGALIAYLQRALLMPSGSPIGKPGSAEAAKKSTAITLRSIFGNIASLDITLLVKNGLFRLLNSEKNKSLVKSTDKVYLIELINSLDEALLKNVGKVNSDFSSLSQFVTQTVNDYFDPGEPFALLESIHPRHIINLDSARKTPELIGYLKSRIDETTDFYPYDLEFSKIIGQVNTPYDKAMVRGRILCKAGLKPCEYFSFNTDVAFKNKFIHYRVFDTKTAKWVDWLGNSAGELFGFSDLKGSDAFGNKLYTSHEGGRVAPSSGYENMIKILARTSSNVSVLESISHPSKNVIGYKEEPLQALINKAIYISKLMYANDSASFDNEFINGVNDAKSMKILCDTLFEFKDNVCFVELWKERVKERLIADKEFSLLMRKEILANHSNYLALSAVLPDCPLQSDLKKLESLFSHKEDSYQPASEPLSEFFRVIEGVSASELMRLDSKLSETFFARFFNELRSSSEAKTWGTFLISQADNPNLLKIPAKRRYEFFIQFGSFIEDPPNPIALQTLLKYLALDKNLPQNGAVELLVDLIKTNPNDFQLIMSTVHTRHWQGVLNALGVYPSNAAPSFEWLQPDQGSASNEVLTRVATQYNSSRGTLKSFRGALGMEGANDDIIYELKLLRDNPNSHSAKLPVFKDKLVEHFMQEYQQKCHSSSYVPSLVTRAFK